jgi:hypothetical protein
MDYAKRKSNAEPFARLPFQWRGALPKRGWNILSEAPSPVGRRLLSVDAERGRLVYVRLARHGSGPEAATGQQRAVMLTEEQQAEALNFTNRLWSEDPVFSEAHRNRLRALVTIILVDEGLFKSFSSCDPADELHHFNEKLWRWAAGTAAQTSKESES